MDKGIIKKIINEYPELKDRLFCRGFLITDDKSLELQSYPFFGLWNEQIIGRHTIIMHPQQRSFVYKNYCLIGHAYNPVRNISDENQILKDIAESVTETKALDYINELTGVFILLKFEDNCVKFLSDPVGLQSVFYTLHNGKYYISSHSNLIGDLLNLKRDSFIEELRSAKYFRLFGNQLPGNLTQFSEVKRYVPNHIVQIGGEVKVTRFYWPHSLELPKAEIEDKLIELIRNSMELIPQKWKKPAISLTGGCDSKTTLACTVGLFDKYQYFSYDSQENEKPDADAAKKICEALGLKHQLYSIPYSDDAFPDIEAIRAIILWNGGDIRPNNKNDVRKRAYLSQRDDFDVDVKSWASEVGRSRYTKHYAGRRDFGKVPSPRVCTTFYKFLFFNRKLVNQTDKVFEEYLDKYLEQDKSNPIPWQDQFYWEWHWPSRDGISLTSEFLYSGEVTVPYNNRKILELLLSMLEEDRINDTVYTSIRNRLCPKIDEACEGVVDANHTSARAKLENMYYVMNRLLPY